MAEPKWATDNGGSPRYRFPMSECGWGYAEFEYDAALRDVQARHTRGSAAAGERYQVRVRVPHDSGKKRLGLNGVREAVKRI
jgi:hypothetical protein